MKISKLIIKNNDMYILKTYNSLNFFYDLKQILGFNSSWLHMALNNYFQPVIYDCLNNVILGI